MKIYFLPVLILAIAGCQSTQPSVSTQISTPGKQVAVDKTETEKKQSVVACAPSSSGAKVCQQQQQSPLISTLPVLNIPKPAVIKTEQISERLPKQESDLWQRVKLQLSMPIPNNQRIQHHRNWYLKHPNFMQRINDRAEPFLHWIVETLEAEKMPLELALLPIVESGFDPYAYSSGKAAGLWQFIPGTGKRFGMPQTWWYDGRRDLVASTNGAVAYLRYLLKFFNGNWLHALAAYNSGEGRVLNAIKRNKRKGKSTDFWSLDLPKETRDYVPKLLALADLLKNQQKYGFSFPKIPNQPVLSKVDTGSQIDIALAADLADVELSELYIFNPGLNRWATDPDGPHYLLLPAEKAVGFSQALNDLDSKGRLNWVRHTVVSGDSLNKLAKRYQTNVKTIKKVNKLKGNTIVKGHTLLMPVALKTIDGYFAQNPLLNSPANRNSRHRINYKVKKGDTLWDISRTYKVRVNDLARWNKIGTNQPLKLGKKLNIWLNKGSKNGARKSIAYKVKKGDSLSRIASKFNVKLTDLRRWNRHKLGKYLQPGQMLKLFVDVTRS